MENKYRNAYRDAHECANPHDSEGCGSLRDPEDRLFGNGVVLSIPKGSYETITAADLEAAKPEVKKDDIVVIVTDGITDTLMHWNIMANPGPDKGCRTVAC
jgi:kynurenine formamidase